MTTEIPECRQCGEPTSLLELRDLNGMCADCDEAETERARQAAWATHWEAQGEEDAEDRAHYGGAS